VNRVGGTWSLEHPVNGCRNVLLGNPAVEFDLNLGIAPTIMVRIPRTSVALVYENENGLSIEQDLLIRDIYHPKCAAIGTTGNPYVLVVALIGANGSGEGGDYAIHDPAFHLLANTQLSPAMDGGAAVQESNVVTDFLASSALCSNVPRNLFNARHCQLSLETSVCGADVMIPDIEIYLNAESLRTIYQVTGGDESVSKRYVYAIQGLRIEDDNTVESPCTPTVRSRWVPATCTTATVDAATAAIFSQLLSNSRDKDNPFVRDIFFPKVDSFACAASDLDKVGFKVVVDPNSNQARCWRNVHPDHLNVHDMTVWTVSHPGNSASRNPIKEFANAGQIFLQFPDWHPMDRWQSNKPFFPLLGRLGGTYCTWNNST
jgi:hypothetical protein